jgi:uncharacterized membrane protein
MMNSMTTGLRQPMARPASDGWQWIRDAFGLVGAKPGFWIGCFLLMFVVLMAVSLVPFLGQLVTLFVGPFIVAGFANAARRQALGQGPEINDLLIGLRERPGTLMAVALIYLAGTLVILLVVFAVVFATLGSGITMSGGQLDPEVLAESWPLFLLVWLIAMALILPLLMAYWFAPALVAFDGLGAVEAMKTSFFACLRNIVPFLVYGLVLIPIIVIAALPLLLGLLVVMPMLLATYYTAWRSVFGEH